MRLRGLEGAVGRIDEEQACRQRTAMGARQREPVFLRAHLQQHGRKNAQHHHADVEQRDQHAIAQPPMRDDPMHFASRWCECPAA
ncbi:MAG: hypothetical protein MUF16_17535 [Burkholderiaceae bacterium]|nr:hypothetical protein [Burkholderiaceae bacterium]